MSGSSAADLCFTDSNLWLYAFIAQQDPNKAAKAQYIIQNDDICLSSQVVNEVCSNLLRKASYDEVRLQQVIARFYFAYRVIDLDEQILLAASDLRLKYKFSFWDGVIVAAALAANATILYSEDMHDGLLVENKLRIVNPF
jgi:predicted nucleic acid-binding protein